jgi:voltage-gated potassium channel
MKLIKFKLQLWMRLLIGFFLIIFAGVEGIRFFEGYSLLNALWYIIESLTTVGYGDFVPVTAGGKIFMMAMLLVGISYVLYVLSNGIAMVVEGRVSDVLGRHKMQQRIDSLEKHILICGAGRVGAEVIHNLIQDQATFVVIESNQGVIKELKDQNLLVMEGDATNDEVLIGAGIQKARGIIAALPSDSDNVFITLTAKELNPDIVVVARANRRDSESKLKRAGADKVVAPEALGGRRMATSILRPATVQFIDTIMYRQGNDIEIEEISVPDDSSLCQKTMCQIAIGDHAGATVIAIVRQGEIIVVPGPDEFIKPNDILIGIGLRQQLAKLEQLAVEIGDIKS